jgi:hypothetical protein
MPGILTRKSTLSNSSPQPYHTSHVRSIGHHPGQISEVSMNDALVILCVLYRPSWSLVCFCCLLFSFFFFCSPRPFPCHALVLMHSYTHTCCLSFSSSDPEDECTVGNEDDRRSADPSEDEVGFSVVWLSSLCVCVCVVYVVLGVCVCKCVLRICLASLSVYLITSTTGCFRGTLSFLWQLSPSRGGTPSLPSASVDFDRLQDDLARVQEILKPSGTRACATLYILQHSL